MGMNKKILDSRGKINTTFTLKTVIRTNDLNVDSAIAFGDFSAEEVSYLRQITDNFDAYSEDLYAILKNVNQYSDRLNRDFIGCVISHVFQYIDDDINKMFLARGSNFHLDRLLILIKEGIDYTPLGEIFNDHYPTMQSLEVGILILLLKAVDVILDNEKIYNLVFNDGYIVAPKYEVIIFRETDISFKIEIGIT